MGDAPNVLSPGEDIKPQVTEEDVKQLVQDVYGLEEITIKELNGYDDKNYHIFPNKNSNPNISSIHQHGYVLKIMNSHDSGNSDLVEAQNGLMIYLRSKNINTTTPVPNLHGTLYTVESLPQSISTIQPRRHIVRLLEFQPGDILINAVFDFTFLYKLGKYLANLNVALQGYQHHIYDVSQSIWMLSSAPKVLPFTNVLDPEKKKLVEEIIGEFQTKALPQNKHLEKGLIHGDFNEHNVLVEKRNGIWEIAGILDFGDVSISCYLFELAVAMFYMAHESKKHHLDPFLACGHFIAGYNSVRKLTELELSLLKVCTCTRFAQSFTLSSYTLTLHPENTYVAINQKIGWPLLKEIWNYEDSKLLQLWKDVMASYLMS